LPQAAKRKRQTASLKNTSRIMVTGFLFFLIGEYIKDKAYPSSFKMTLKKRRLTFQPAFVEKLL
jgi:hypothetical protein